MNGGNGMKIVGVLAILAGLVVLIVPLLTRAWQPSWFIAVILLVGGFFLYRGFGRTSQKTP
jgi:uncharacterized membrane protein HdeD (DUF308 family)